MKSVLLATDSDALFAQVDAALASNDCAVLRVRKGADVLPAIRSHDPQMVLLDLQIGNMGGIATCIAVRQEEAPSGSPERPVAIFLDRAVDTFVAQEARADGWLIKPFDSLKLRKLVRTLQEGNTFYEGVEPATAEKA